MPMWLRPWALGWSGYEERARGRVERLELPGPFVPVILAFGGMALRSGEGEGPWQRQAGAFVTGLDEGPTLTAHGGFQAGMEVKLTPLGAWRFFGQPLAPWQGQVLAWEEVAPPGLKQLPQGLEALPSWAERFDLLEASLGRQLVDSKVALGLADAAVQGLQRSGGRLPLQQLANDLGASPKRLRRAFEEQVGLGPKGLARLIRFDAVRRRLKEAKPQPWADLALEMGFSDQAHLVRELRAFSGFTPTQLAARLASEPWPEA